MKLEALTLIESDNVTAFVSMALAPAAGRDWLGASGSEM
jgi:hypothetical protein